MDEREYGERTGWSHGAPEESGAVRAQRRRERVESQADARRDLRSVRGWVFLLVAAALAGALIEAVGSLVGDGHFDVPHAGSVAAGAAVAGLLVSLWDARPLRDG